MALPSGDQCNSSAKPFSGTRRRDAALEAGSARKMAVFLSAVQSEKKARCFESGDHAMPLSLPFAPPVHAVMSLGWAGSFSGATLMPPPGPVTFQAIELPSG